MRIKIKVKANSGRQEIIKDNEEYRIYLKSPPENNKANIELIQLLKRYFGKPVRIISGFTSRKKVIELREKE